MFWKKGYQDPKKILETIILIVKPKAVEKEASLKSNCVFEIKIDLSLVGNGTPHFLDLYIYISSLREANYMWE